MNKMLNPSNDCVGAVLVCAVRYALGRRTYMPSMVCCVIQYALSDMSDRDICCIERDIIEQGERFKGDDTYKPYGDDIDKIEWMKLLDALTAERKRRGVERWTPLTK